MTAGPVIKRELRAEARSPVTHRTRLFAAAVLVLLVWLSSWQLASHPSMGKSVFLNLHTTIYLLIWILVPVLLHDTISRERREGTLGLLLLTPLTGAGVVIAKGFVGLLRSAGIVIAAVPVLAVPILLGGVSAAELGRAVLMELMALLGATAAALLASSLSVERHRALAAAMLLAFVFQALLSGSQAIPAGLPIWQGDPVATMFHVLTFGFRMATNVAGFAPPLSVTLQSVAAAASVLALTLMLAGRRLKEHSADTGPSKRQQRLFKVFCSPVIFGGYLQGRLRSALNRNPIGWLQQRRWSSRLSQWGWLAILLASSTWLVSYGWTSFRNRLVLLAALLGANICLSAAGSFRDERRNGALELLLVTPLKGREVLLGRLRGIWMQFLLPAAVWLVLWNYATYWRYANLHLQLVVILAFLVLPMVGIHQSFVRRTLLGAWLKTFFVGLVVPSGASIFIAGLLRDAMSTPVFDAYRTSDFWGAVLHLGMLAWLGVRSHASVIDLLDRRSFVVEEAK